ncbi:class I SAM-dependent methyltransferase [Hymenobacter busanensis]|uniref:Class I SAM-dependent methyltransferase n=1 Tax=Hymenobacter busanensis TaxID=2607656 RepID=A0A7L4ZYA5_9BACT|nr:class I SAM-dependent methyltransferase [Hymenobacter busanensis]KAA9333074.1 class I SAM-dependent methyltransferase [Hymenobacter busanensis]QHJ08251.1 methyltransferase domain-containing protein [Hymenobacter busanensis]
MPHTRHEAEWFSTWFDSPYYHQLYHNRDQDEAQHFLDNLLVRLHPKPKERLLDLACGKGRHAIYLNQQGYNVTGIDLSPESIEHARQFANERLQFHVHDMRAPLPYGPFDFILNLFTSFGYFDEEAENVVALRNAADALQYGGKLVIDFMNTERAVRELVAHEEKTVDGITFHLNRHLDRDFIVKEIRFTDREGQPQHFQERVRALTVERFREYFYLAGLRLAEVLGDYDLNPYVEESSPRMIFILKK